MPHREALRNFTKRTGYELDNENLLNRLTNVVRTQPTLDDIESNAITSMRNLFKVDAARHERRRQEANLRALAHPKSKRLLKTANALANQTAFVREYVSLSESLVKIAEMSQRKTTENLPGLGMTGEDFVGMMREQLNSYTYREGRRFQLFHAVGIKSQKFINELSGLKFDIADKGIKYSTAGENDKAKIHEVYVTKDLVETRLNDKSRLWKFFHPGQTKAMKAYLDRANTFLDTVEFPKPVPDEAKAFANQGYEFAKLNRKNELEAEFARIAKEVDQKLAEPKAARDAKNAEKKAELDRQAALRQAELEKQAAEKEAQRVEAQKNLDEKLAQTQAEADAVRGKDIKDQIFEIRFRPSLDENEFWAQYNTLKEILPRITGNLPHGVKTVVKANYNKLQSTKTFMRSKENMSEKEIKENENSLRGIFLKEEDKALASGHLKDYTPLTYAEFENIELQQKLSTDTGEKKNDSREVSSKKNDAPKIQKESNARK